MQYSQLWSECWWYCQVECWGMWEVRHSHGTLVRLMDHQVAAELQRSNWSLVISWNGVITQIITNTVNQTPDTVFLWLRNKTIKYSRWVVGISEKNNVLSCQEFHISIWVIIHVHVKLKWWNWVHNKQAFINLAPKSATMHCGKIWLMTLLLTY